MRDPAVARALCCFCPSLQPRLRTAAYIMALHKPTTDPKQIWTFLGLAAFLCAIFGYAVLPLMDPGRGKLGGQQAPDFTLKVLSGGEQDSRLALSDQQGQVVILDFWASWCLPCREQAPILERFAATHKDDKVTVIGVNTGDVEPAALDFVRTAGITYPTVFDEQGAVARAFHAEELPTLVVIDPTGKVIATAARVVREGQLEEWLEKLLVSEQLEIDRFTVTVLKAIEEVVVVASAETNIYAVILAGGSGTRFWPASRVAFPKQLLALGPSAASLIRETYKRLSSLTTGDKILVATGKHLLTGTRSELPELSEASFLGEPWPRTRHRVSHGRSSGFGEVIPTPSWWLCRAISTSRTRSDSKSVCEPHCARQKVVPSPYWAFSPRDRRRVTATFRQVNRLNLGFGRCGVSSKSRTDRLPRSIYALVGIIGTPVCSCFGRRCS